MPLDCNKNEAPENALSATASLTQACPSRVQSYSQHIGNHDRALLNGFGVF